MKEIDLIKLLKVFFKNIPIIFVVTFISAFLFYNYQSSLPKKYESNIVIKKPSYEKFSSEFIITSDNDLEEGAIILSFYDEFINDFTTYMASADNLQFFLYQNDQENLKNKLKITEDKTILNLQNSNQKSSILEFKIFYDEGINGPEILNNYTQYVKNLTTKEYRTKRLLYLQRLIYKYAEALEVSREIKQEYPIINSVTGDNNSSVLYAPNDLFYTGSKVLAMQLYHLKTNFKKIKNSEINYQFILDKASKGKWINNYKKNYALFGIFLGLILSIIIVLIRSKIKI